MKRIMVRASSEHGLGPAVRIESVDLDDMYQMCDGRWYVWASEPGYPERGEHITADSPEALRRRIHSLRH